MLRPEKVATPATAAAVAVPRSTAPVVPVPDVIATVTFPAKPVAVLPKPSLAITTTAGVIDAPAAAAVGCTENARLAAVPATAVAEIAVVTPGATFTVALTDCAPEVVPSVQVVVASPFALV